MKKCLCLHAIFHFTTPINHFRYWKFTGVKLVLQYLNNRKLRVKPVIFD